MHEPRSSDFLAKTNSAFVTAVKDASCNSGWVRFIVQAIFGIITVASFTMILIMAMQRNPAHKTLSSQNSHCVFSGCRVVCTEAPSYGLYEADIVNSVTTVNQICNNIHLCLYNANFVNQTFPKNWLWFSKAKIRRLTITGGNLHYIEPSAFMSNFFNSLEYLELEDITLAEWHSDMLVGLQMLKSLVIKECKLGTIHNNALRPVDETLQSLQIKNSGSWAIENVTGSSYLAKLTEINFSHNFVGLLKSNSFTRIDRCKVIDLSNSAITKIEPHTFDYIFNIEFIDLSNNRLLTLPDSLFTRVLTLESNTPKIYFFGNMWHCDCNLQYLVDLFFQRVLMDEPLCNSPTELHKSQISIIQQHCPKPVREPNHLAWQSRHPTVKGFVAELELFDDTNDGLGCNSTNLVIVSPVRRYECSSETTSYLDQFKLMKLSSEAQPTSNQLQPTFFINSTNLSMLEFTTKTDYHSGLIWFRSNCRAIIFCIDVIPKHLKIYNVGANVEYTLCPINRSGFVEPESCIAYRGGQELSNLVDWLPPTRRFILYAIAIITAVLFGASLLYGIIRKNPALLRGSKRVLLVKHKVADAIILPPKVSLKENDICYKQMEQKNIKEFFKPERKMETLQPEGFKKSFSIRSSKSNAPSYISAMQPTEDQLKEWRLKHHFDNYSTLTSINSTQISCIFDENKFSSLHFESIGSADSRSSRMILE